MIERLALRGLWPRSVGAFLAWFSVVLVSTYFRLLPLEVRLAGMPAPDFLLVFTYAWLVRRPQHLPVLALASVWLVEDLVLLRPPGLWALCVVLGAEFLRARHTLLREMELFAEWALVGAVLVALWLAERMVLLLFMVPTPPLEPSLTRLALTILVYPLAVGVLYFGFRIRKPATGELDDLGRPV